MRRRRGSPDTGVRPEVAGPFRVVFVPRETARRLVDLGPDNWCWTDADYGPHLYGEAVRGSLVKVQPPAGVTPERVAAVEAALLAAGALVVRVLPPAAAHEAPAPEHVPAARRTIREVVEACARKAHTQDREALEAVLDESLTAEGL